jgi:hypothetical protein
MTELSRRVRTAPTLALLFAALLILLIACDTPTNPSVIKPEVSLLVDETDLADGGGEVTLTAKVTRGKATSVTFTADTGIEIPSATETTAGEFVTKVNVTTTTRFTAQASGPGGAGATTQAKTVTVAPANPVNDPEAPSSTAALKGFEDVDLAVGSWAGLAVSVTTIPGVTGNISGEVQAETIETSKGTVTIKAGADKLEFLYAPKPGAEGSDSFQYTVLKTGRTDKGTITIALQPLPVAIDIIDGETDDAGDITGSLGDIIMLAKDVTCNSDRCVRLEAGQQLIGVGSVTINGVTITNASSTKPKIIANIPGTRQPGTPGGSGSESKVIELADDTKVEGIEIDGAGARYFVALFGATYDGAAVLEGDITIKNVLINNSNGKPIYFKCTDFPCSQSVNYGAYNLTIENLRVENAFDTLVIGAPGSLVFKNSFVDLRQPTVNSQSFGDNVGIDIEDLLSASLEFNNVDVYMQSPKNKLDNNPINYGAIPFVITNRRPSGTTRLTFLNNDITFGTPDSNWSLGSVRTMRLSASAGASIAISNSANNTSQATGNDVERNGAITGTLGGLE